LHRSLGVVSLTRPPRYLTNGASVGAARRNLDARVARHATIYKVESEATRRGTAVSGPRGDVMRPRDMSDDLWSVVSLDDLPDDDVLAAAIGDDVDEDVATTASGDVVRTHQPSTTTRPKCTKTKTTRSVVRRNERERNRVKQVRDRFRRSYDTIRDAILTCAQKPT